MACGLGSGDTGGRRARARGQEAAEGCTGKERSVGGTVRVTRRPCHVRFQPRPFSSTGPPRASTSPRDVVDHLEFRQRPYVRYRSARNHATTLFVELPLSRSAPSPRSSSVKLAAARVSLDRQEIIRGTTYRTRSIVATRYRRRTFLVQRNIRPSTEKRDPALTTAHNPFLPSPFLSLPLVPFIIVRSSVRPGRCGPSLSRPLLRVAARLHQGNVAAVSRARALTYAHSDRRPRSCTLRGYANVQKRRRVRGCICSISR